MARVKIATPEPAQAATEQPEQEQTAAPVEPVEADAAQAAADLLDAPTEPAEPLPPGTLEGWISLPRTDRQELVDLGVIVLDENPNTDGQELLELFCRVPPEVLEKLAPHWGQFTWALGEPGKISPDKPWEAEPTPPASAIDAPSTTPAAPAAPTAVPSPAIESPATPDPKAIWQQKLHEAKDNYIAAAIHRKTCEDELKAAKADEKDALACVQRLIDRGPEPLPLFDGKKSQPVTEAVGPVCTVTNPEPTRVASPAVDVWRSAPLSALNLKLKLAERLEENGITTIGKLEDLRAEIALGREKWPKGIGAAKVTDIENAVIAWLTENRDQALFNGGANQATSEAAAEPASTEAAEATTAEAAPAINADNWDTLSDEEQADFLNHRATFISENLAGETNHLDQKLDGATFWQSGYDAYGRGDEVKDCPVVPGLEQDDWLRGYFAAAAVEEYEPSEEADEESETDESADLDGDTSDSGEDSQLVTAGNSHPLVSIDDL